MQQIHNFGRNIEFTPQEILAPRSVAELLNVLSTTGTRKIRVMGARHAWSAGIETPDILVDLQHLNQINLHGPTEQRQVTVGGGCTIGQILAELNRHELTLPSIGLITEQTIAGATATGTHGTGKPGISHFIQSAKVVCFEEGRPVLREISDGDELRAVRCSLGAMGIVVELTFPAIPQYFVTDRLVRFGSLQEALSRESKTPLQQVFLIPLGWQIYGQCREVADTTRISRTSWLYRAYWNVGLCLGFVTLMKLLVSVLRSRRLLRWYYRWMAPWLIFTGWKVTDRSDRLLVIKHESFRHLELELFVPQSRIIEAADFLIEILSAADRAEYRVSGDTRRRLEEVNMADALNDIRGKFAHHCPICIRKILPEDTLISMASGDQAWYAISLITYALPRDDFYAVTTFLANSFFRLFGGRIHWGKWFPLDADTVEQQYPELDRFRKICREFDPAGRFQNEFVQQTLGLQPVVRENV